MFDTRLVKGGAMVIPWARLFFLRGRRTKRSISYETYPTIPSSSLAVEGGGGLFPDAAMRKDFEQSHEVVTLWRSLRAVLAGVC